MFLFAFNLYTQINPFIKHIFTNKFITTPYYIRWSASRCLVAGVGVVVLPGGCHRWSGPRWLVVSSVEAPW